MSEITENYQKYLKLPKLFKELAKLLKLSDDFF